MTTFVASIPTSTPSLYLYLYPLPDRGGHFWPDGSVGECDACHPKHTFDVAVARNPYTCGECHIGPDHPHIEIWEESKHGNVFLVAGTAADGKAVEEQVNGLKLPGKAGWQYKK